MIKEDEFAVRRRYTELAGSGIFVVDLDILAPEKDREISHGLSLTKGEYKRILKQFRERRKFVGSTITHEPISRWASRFCHIPREYWFDVPHVNIMSPRSQLSAISMYEHQDGSQFAYRKNIDFKHLGRLPDMLDALAQRGYTRAVIVDNRYQGSSQLEQEQVMVSDLDDASIVMLKLQI